MKKQVASLVEAELKRAAKSEAQESNEEQYFMSMVEAAVTKTLNQQNEQNLSPNLNFPQLYPQEC